MNWVPAGYLCACVCSLFFWGGGVGVCFSLVGVYFLSLFSSPYLFSLTQAPIIILLSYFYLFLSLFYILPFKVLVYNIILFLPQSLLISLGLIPHAIYSILFVLPRTPFFKLNHMCSFSPCPLYKSTNISTPSKLSLTLPQFWSILTSSYISPSPQKLPSSIQH